MHPDNIGSQFTDVEQEAALEKFGVNPRNPRQSKDHYDRMKDADKVIARMEARKANGGRFFS